MMIKMIDHDYDLDDSEYDYRTDRTDMTDRTDRTDMETWEWQHINSNDVYLSYLLLYKFDFRVPGAVGLCPPQVDFLQGAFEFGENKSSSTPSYHNNPHHHRHHNCHHHHHHH